MEEPISNRGWKDVLLPNRNPRPSVPIGLQLIVTVAIFALLVSLNPDYDHILANICVVPFPGRFVSCFGGAFWWIAVASGICVILWGPLYPIIKVGLFVTVLADFVEFLGRKLEVDLTLSRTSSTLGHQVSRTLSNTPLALGYNFFLGLLRTPLEFQSPSRFRAIVASMALFGLVLLWLGLRYKRIVRIAASWVWWLLVASSSAMPLWWAWAWWGLRSLLSIPVWFINMFAAYALSIMAIAAVLFAGYCFLDESVGLLEERCREQRAKLGQPRGSGSQFPRTTGPHRPAHHEAADDRLRSFNSTGNSNSESPETGEDHTPRRYTADDWLRWFNSTGDTDSEFSETGEDHVPYQYTADDWLHWFNSREDDDSESETGEDHTPRQYTAADWLRWFNSTGDSGYEDAEHPGILKTTQSGKGSPSGQDRGVHFALPYVHYHPHANLYSRANVKSLKDPRDTSGGDITWKVGYERRNEYYYRPFLIEVPGISYNSDMVSRAWVVLDKMLS